MGFYHQIWSGFPVKIVPSSNSMIDMKTTNYPLVISYIAIEHGNRKFVDFPIKHGYFPELC